MPEGIRIDGFRDPSLAGPLSISLDGKELLVLAGPAGTWMSRLASSLAGMGSGRHARMPSGRTHSERGLVLLRPPFFDPGRDILQQLENRLTACGVKQSGSREQATAWCETEGLSRESRKKAGSLPEGLLCYFALALPCIARPAALVLEDPLPGMPADLAARTVRILCELAKYVPVLVLCADPIRFEGSARVETVPGVEGAI
jgi:ABC-type taurine transport system ATPase subunit